MKKTYDINWSRKSHTRMNIKKTNHGLKVGDVIKIKKSFKPSRKLQFPPKEAFYIQTNAGDFKVGEYVHGLGVTGRVTKIDKYGIKVRKLNLWERFTQRLRSSK